MQATCTKETSVGLPAGRYLKCMYICTKENRRPYHLRKNVSATIIIRLDLLGHHIVFTTSGEIAYV